jgi:glycosyltransferase involved in cell wall biosynthesis
MRIAIDATPAATQTAGVGRYTRELIRTLLSSTDDNYVLACAASAAECDRLSTTFPPGAWREVRRLPLAEPWATRAWQRLRLPIRIEQLIGTFDVLHAPDFVAPPTQRPLVVTIHDLSFINVPHLGHPDLVAYLQQAVPRTLSRATAIITVSATMAGDLVERWPACRHRVVAIPNGVHPVNVSSGRATMPEQPVVLCVGTVEPRKNHLTLLRAMRRVREQHPGTRLIVAGRQGWCADDIAATLRREEAAGWLNWHDSVNDEQLERLYRSCDLVAYPSRYEGFGLPVLEALARGIPVVAGDILALRETGGDAAIYADPDDDEALAVAIGHLIDDEGLRTTLVERGLRRAADLTWENTANRTRRVYDMVAGDARR